MVYSRSSYSSLPPKAGVYVFLSKDDTVLYVGKAKSLKARVSSYFVNSNLLGEKTKLLVSHIDKIKITIVESELEALLLEAFYIKKYKPKYNIRLMDNKSYLKIRITVKDTYPKVFFARREEDKNSLFFGPYPNASAARLVVKTIRKVFPFQSVLNHPKRICLYNHLGLCPCPPVHDSPAFRKEYKKNIQGIIRILEGESKKIMRELEKERDTFSKKEEYEQALKVQKKINSLSIITTPFRQPFEYHINPNLRVDIRQKEMDQLMEVLNHQSNVILRAEESQTIGDPSLTAQDDKLIKKLERIECYDISNIQGTNATGSMVVFVHGEKESSQYRRFKIRRDWEKKKTVIPSEVEGSHTTDQLERNDKKDTPNDFAMMQEVLKRRFAHEEWNMPDLVIIDGGKGQVSAAVEALSGTSPHIPIIGLAKREETIIVPLLRHPELKRRISKLWDSSASPQNDKENFLEISLPKNSPPLHLIMRIRDEAHRFAVTYHKHLRSKQMTK